MESIVVCLVEVAATNASVAAFQMVHDSAMFKIYSSQIISFPVVLESTLRMTVTWVRATSKVKHRAARCFRFSNLPTRAQRRNREFRQRLPYFGKLALLRVGQLAGIDRIQHNSDRMSHT